MYEAHMIFPFSSAVLEVDEVRQSSGNSVKAIKYLQEITSPSL